jgi:hypothetical protein
MDNKQIELFYKIKHRMDEIEGCEKKLGFFGEINNMFAIDQIIRVTFDFEAGNSYTLSGDDIARLQFDLADNIIFYKNRIKVLENNLDELKQLMIKLI